MSKKTMIYKKNSFKERGARYALMCLTGEQRKNGVIAASAGNHAQGLAYHGKLLGIPVTCVMSTIAPLMKIQKCINYGANVVVQGNSVAEARNIALKMAKESGALYVSGYDHPNVLAGVGSMGLEISEQVDNIDAILIPVGGGGMIAGVGLAIKSLFPTTKIIGVSSEHTPGMQISLKQKKPTFVACEPTLADGLAVPLVGCNSFAVAAPLIDKMVLVKEDHIALAIVRLVELEKFVVEGAGAIGLAALLSGQLDELKGKKVVLVLSGGNIDTTVFSRCVDRGLAVDHRLIRFVVNVCDKPGGLSEVCRLLASIGVSVKDVTYDRAFTKADVFHVDMKFICETRDETHNQQLIHLLAENFDSVVLPGFSCKRPS